ncbi:MAG: hypothetical protein ACRYFS_21780 [Janthinobacterium lividum]
MPTNVHLAMPHLSVPTASFLNYHVANVYQLSQEVTVDPQVRARLASHFHLSESQMTTYIHHNLVLQHLQKAGIYQVACVRRNGSEYWVTSRLPAGTAVFASRATGQPVLKLACGNPMVSALPPSLIPNKTQVSPLTASTPLMLADAALDPPPVLTAVDGSQADLITTDNLSAPPVVEVSPSLQLLRGSSLLPLFALAGAAVAVSGHHSPNSNSTPPIAAVPEASTVTSFGLLLAGSALVFLRRKALAKNS